VKLRVRGYHEHKLKDPYKYWSTLLDTPPRHKKRCIAQFTYVTRIDEETLQFSYGRKDDKYWPDKEFCLLRKDDVWTITASPGTLQPGLSNRINALTGTYPGWNKKGFPLHENPCRIYESYAARWKYPAGDSWPYEPGMQVFRCELLHKGRYIDRKRTIESTAALDVKRKLRKIYELAPVMVRLLESQGDRQPTRWTAARRVKEELFQEFDLDNVNALDAERVYLIGEGHTYRRTTVIRPGSYDARTGKWTACQEKQEPLDEYRKRCVVNGLRKLREHIYSKEGVYQYEPVNK
jgi:hypothetical protein